MLIYMYENAEIIGSFDDDYVRYYRSNAHWPEGTIRLGDLPHESYNLFEEFQGLSESTLVYIA